MAGGWITLHRKLLDSPLAKKPDAMHLWIHLLLKTNHRDGEYILGNQVIKIPKGSLMTGRMSLQKTTGLNQHKVDRLLVLFEKMGFIEQQTFSKYRLISITNWGHYQEREQQVSNKRAASEQQVSTNNNVNNDNNVNKKERAGRFAPPSLSDVNNYIAEKNLTVNGQQFIDHYVSNGWKVGKNPMKDWKATLRNWGRRENDKPANKPKTTSARFMEGMRNTWHD